MLEAIKRPTGDPPVRKGAGYNEVYTASRGLFCPAGPLPRFFQTVFSLEEYIFSAPCPGADFPLAQYTLIRYNN